MGREYGPARRIPGGILNGAQARSAGRPWLTVPTREALTSKPITRGSEEIGDREPAEARESETEQTAVARKSGCVHNPRKRDIVCSVSGTRGSEETEARAVRGSETAGTRTVRVSENVGEHRPREREGVDPELDPRKRGRVTGSRKVRGSVTERRPICPGRTGRLRRQRKRFRHGLDGGQGPYRNMRST